MPLQKEIWINDLVENLFADNTFASRSVDHSVFVDGKKVHVPNAGAAPTVKKNRSTVPASATKRTDVDLEYEINEYTTDPILVSNAENVELSYSKRKSVIRNTALALQDEAHSDLIYSWIPSSKPETIATSGESVVAHIATATGNRKALTKADILKVKAKFDAADVPQTGRCILVDAVMYNQLLESLTEMQSNAFLTTADASRGIIGKLFGFDFYMRSKVAKTTSAGVLKEWSASAAATDSAAALAWQEDSVSRALGQNVLFENEGSALYYGDVLSGLVRAGGRHMRNDNKGVCLIYQATVS